MRSIEIIKSELSYKYNELLILLSISESGPAKNITPFVSK